ncbi:type II secretion system F family protein [Paenibacillus lutrae]|nr:type II secretion system F family protein [Paenibacillus lutrae]
MKIITAAALIGFGIWLIFYIADKKKKLSEFGTLEERTHVQPQEAANERMSISIRSRLINFGRSKHELLPEESSKLARSAAVRNNLTDYNVYQMSPKEQAFTIGITGLVFAGVSFIFYKQLLLSLAGLLLGLLMPRFRRIRLMHLRKERLNQQFKQALYCMSTSLSAGRSVESSFRETWKDLKLLYPDPNCLIVLEFEIIVRRLDNGEPIEKAVADFACRAGTEDISNFADVFITCKRTGGNLVEVIRRTAAIIGDKLEIVQDISVLVAQKRFESRILLAAPIAMVAVLSFSSPDYMAPLYSGIGPLIMTGGLLVLAACFWLITKIMDIKV